MKKTDLDFKAAHDKNGIPICCMTCKYWSFGGGRSCGSIEPKAVCTDWEISKYYANNKEVLNGSNKSKTP